MNSVDLNYIKDNLQYILDYVLYNYNIKDIPYNPYFDYIKSIEVISSVDKKKLLRDIEIDILNSDSLSQIRNLETRKKRIQNLHIDDTSPHNYMSKRFTKRLNEIHYNSRINTDLMREGVSIPEFILNHILECINNELLKITCIVEEIEVNHISDLIDQINQFNIINNGIQVSGRFSNNLYNLFDIGSIYGKFDLGYNRILLSPLNEGIILSKGLLQISEGYDVGFMCNELMFNYRSFFDILSIENSKIININMSIGDDFFK